MKVLIMNTWYYPNMMGGAEYSVKILAETLANVGQNVSVFCVDSKNGFRKEIINGVKIYRSDGGKYNLYRAYFQKRSRIQKIYDKYHEIWNDSLESDVNVVLDEFKPDIVHCNCISGISLSVFNILKNKNIPVVLTLRNYFFIWPFEKKIKYKPLAKIFEKIYCLVCKSCTGRVSAVTAPSDYTLNFYLKEGFFENIRIKQCIPNCILYEKNILDRNIKIKTNRTDTFIHFLYAGWITEPKGIKILLEAFSEIQDEYIDLTLCGDGNMVDFVKNVARKDSRIHYKGKLSQEELRYEYELADVLIVPSVWDEPFGRVVIEGNLYALPVIAGNRGGIPEIINHTCGGILYESDNVDELVRAIVFMSNRDNIKAYIRSLSKGLDYYSEESQANLFCELYLKCMKGKCNANFNCE